MLRRVIRSALLALSCLPGAVRASCGLEEANYGLRWNTWSLTLGGRHVAYDFGDPTGEYAQFELRGDWSSTRWRLGVWGSFVDLQTGDGSRRGTTNPVLYAERVLSPKALGMEWLLGAQLECPLGSDEPSIRDDHWEALPYLGIGRDFGRVDARVLVGWREALFDDSGPAETVLAKHDGVDHGTVLVVAPHSGSEFVGRLVLSSRLFSEASRLQLTLDTQHVVEDDVEADQFQVLGAQWLWRLHERWALMPSAQFPFGDDQRFTRGFELHLQHSF